MLLLTQEEVAERLHVTVRTVYRLRMDGEIAYLPGRPVMIPEAELEAYVRRSLVRQPQRPERGSMPVEKRVEEMILREKARKLKASGQTAEAAVHRAKAAAIRAQWPSARKKA